MGIGSCCPLLRRENNNTCSTLKIIKIALAGNANVGKSALFNHLTGMSQHVANWPGKTVEIVCGTARFGGYDIRVVDLPGIYSFSTFSIEEQVTEEYITKEKPDIVINVIDSMALERNLFFTTQLFEKGVPVIIALNQSDVAERKGIDINAGKLSSLLSADVVKTVATKGIGVYELLAACVRIAENGNAKKADIRRLCKKDAKTEERYKIAAEIVAQVQRQVKYTESLGEKIDELTTHSILGYLIMLLALGAVFYSIFTFGSWLSGYISAVAAALRPHDAAQDVNLLWEGVIGGFVAGVTLVLPYVLPFYFLLSLLEDTGYITRIAYLLDGVAHRIGFHGKAIIPLLLSYGCNVPACISCRIMEYDRDRLITAFAVTLVPCTARTVVILSLVGAYLGIWWALFVYALNILVVAILAKIAFRVVPGEPVGMVMEMPRYRMPSLSVAIKQTILRTKSLLTIVFPYYMAGGLLLALLQLSGLFGMLNNIMAPLITRWLGLPALTGTLLLAGLVRKELIVVLPSILYGTTDLSTIFTPLQMVVLSVVAMMYAPCLATIEALRREFGLDKAVFITLFEVVFAIFLGGVVAVVLAAAGLS